MKADVEAIRASNETHRVLAERYGVGRSHIGKIRSGFSFRSTASTPYQRKIRPPKPPHVQTKPRKMTPEKVIAFRAARAQGRTIRECAALFGLSYIQASKIAHGRSWKNVAPSDGDSNG